MGCSFLFRNLIRIFRFQTKPLCWFACRWVGCSFLLRNLIKNQASESLVDQGCAVVFFFGFTSRSWGSTPGLHCWVTFRWVGRSFLLRNRIKVSMFYSRRLCWGRVVDRWAVFSFFGMISRSLGSKPGLFAESVVAGWAPWRLKWGTRLKFGSRKVRDKSLDAEFIHIGVSDLSFSFKIKWSLPLIFHFFIFSTFISNP